MQTLLDAFGALFFWGLLLLLPAFLLVPLVGPLGYLIYIAYMFWKFSDRRRKSVL